jgi:hypothetical protein
LKTNLKKKDLVFREREGETTVAAAAVALRIDRGRDEGKQ